MCGSLVLLSIDLPPLHRHKSRNKQHTHEQAKAAHHKRLQEYAQEQRRRQAQHRGRQSHPGNRGGNSLLPAVADDGPGRLIDPEFADMMQELLRPVEDTSAPPSPHRRVGAPQQRRQWLLGEGEGLEGEGLLEELEAGAGVSMNKEEALARVDVEVKRGEMATRELEVGGGLLCVFARLVFGLLGWVVCFGFSQAPSVTDTWHHYLFRTKQNTHRTDRRASPAPWRSTTDSSGRTACRAGARRAWRCCGWVDNRSVEYIHV